MMTALLIAILVLVILGTVFMVRDAFRGCPFATLWLVFGGLGKSVELIGLLWAAIAEAVGDSN